MIKNLIIYIKYRTSSRAELSMYKGRPDSFNSELSFESNFFRVKHQTKLIFVKL